MLRLAVKRLDTIAKAVVSCLRVVPGDHKLECQRAVLVAHLYRAA